MFINHRASPIVRVWVISTSGCVVTEDIDKPNLNKTTTPKIHQYLHLRLAYMCLHPLVNVYFEDNNKKVGGSEVWQLSFRCPTMVWSGRWEQAGQGDMRSLGVNGFRRGATAAGPDRVAELDGKTHGIVRPHFTDPRAPGPPPEVRWLGWVPGGSNHRT